MEAREQMEIAVQEANSAIFHLAIVASAWPEMTADEIADVRAMRDKLTEIIVALLPRKVA